MKLSLTNFAVLISICLLWPIHHCYSQALTNSKSVVTNYNAAFDSLNKLAQSNGSFSDAVFLVENAYYGNSLSKENFDRITNYLTELCLQNAQLQSIGNYKFADSANFRTNLSIFNTLFDTTIIVGSNGNGLKRVVPYSYNHSDPFGKMDWSNMFVSKLLSSRTGNCHSLTYLYKIISDKITSTKCWLSLAPSHLYIRNYSLHYGWYNSELTSASFPTDAWIMASGYVTPDAIRSGLYMDTLSNVQSIALCLTDLAKGYEIQTKEIDDGFILKCCELALMYHPNNPMALLQKAETLQKIYLKQKQLNDPKQEVTYQLMSSAYIYLATLGYREMPEKMYLQWISEAKKSDGQFKSQSPHSPKKKAF
ncbi:MAG: hypothetical protein QM664_06005 [Flavihumibacter sp.]